MALILIPSTNISANTHLFKYWNAPSTNRSWLTLGAATYPTQIISNITFGTGYLLPGFYIFSLRVSTANSAKGSCSITYPWSETSSGSTPIGLNKQIVSFYISYISVTVTAIYPNTFKGWYTQQTGGTLLTTTATVNVFYNNGYDDWYAQWN